ncbi:MAG: hypothetical protein J7M19_06785 [Planctomycetes bacterium]|nr:hypothetical protein [Planctomycetota bacterium]
MVYSASGQELSREPLAVKDSAALVEAEIPPAGVLVVELEAPPWEVSSASRK